MMGAIPDPHGVVTDHDGLAMYGDFRKVAEPRELVGHGTTCSISSRNIARRVFFVYRSNPVIIASVLC
jgi:hypothetical protein